VAYGRQGEIGFSELLRQLRIQAGLTQEELAATARVSPRSVGPQSWRPDRRRDRRRPRAAGEDHQENYDGRLHRAEPRLCPGDRGRLRVRSRRRYIRARGGRACGRHPCRDRAHEGRAGGGGGHPGVGQAGGGARRNCGRRLRGTRRLWPSATEPRAAPRRCRPTSTSRATSLCRSARTKPTSWRRMPRAARSTPSATAASEPDPTGPAQRVRCGPCSDHVHR
jgi:hypothetical protein